MKESREKGSDVKRMKYSSRMVECRRKGKCCEITK
jgi:hypothetical protein